MSKYKIQGVAEKRNGIYYEFDTDDMPLGTGGMGKVFKGCCVNENTGAVRNVAIKFIYDDAASNPYVIEKARREAAIHFRHENLVEMLGFIETEDKTVLGESRYHYHVVSELLEGVSLDSLFTGRLVDQQGNFVPFAEKLFRDYQQDVCHFSINLVKNILSGLMTMHDAGYIHRDIDPTNIMITADGHIKLIDFGIAKKINSLTTHDKHLTQAGQFIGKPEYAAPELVLGSINEQNQTTDIYAVGILLFQCLVGHIPFEGDRSEIMHKQLHSPMPLKLVKDRRLRAIIAKATEKTRAKRFQSAAEFRVALEQMANVKPSFEWKPLYNYIIGGVAACSVAGLAMLFWSDSNAGEMLTYDSVVAEMNDGQSAVEILKEMRELSDRGDDKATYMLSRLLFRSKSATDYMPDSILSMQERLGLKTDYAQAHALLQKAVKQNGENYFALYELACDYWKAYVRTPVVKERDKDKAKQYFLKAREYASKANDTRYVDMIDTYLSQVKQLEDNLMLIQKNSN